MGFGSTGPAVDAVVRTGTAAYIDAAVRANPASDKGVAATPPPTFAPITPLPANATADQRQQRNKDIAAQLSTLTSWWLKRMVAVEQPFIEKVTFGWHNHFATSASKVRDAGLLVQQNEALRKLGRGDFRTLCNAMLTDAAMLRWLDGDLNTATAPNENLAREFMELFTLGHGNGYSENDVREGARALTGWKARADGTTFLNVKQHDQGSKTVLGVQGNLDASGFCDAVLAVPAGSQYLVQRWWGQLGSENPLPSSSVANVITAYGANRDLAQLFAALFRAPEFGSGERSLVVSPVEWLVGATRALKVNIAADAAAQRLVRVLQSLGQVPFYPPNVSGWPAGQAWLSTAAVDVRMQTALILVKTADLSTVTDAAVTDRVDAAGYLLGVGSWSDRTAGVLRDLQTNPPNLVAVALTSPEYLVH